MGQSPDGLEVCPFDIDLDLSVATRQSPGTATR